MYSIYGARGGVTVSLRIRILSLPKDPPRKYIGPAKYPQSRPLNPPLGPAKDDAPQHHRICQPRSLLATLSYCWSKYTFANAQNHQHVKVRWPKRAIPSFPYGRTSILPSALPSISASALPYIYTSIRELHNFLRMRKVYIYISPFYCLYGWCAMHHGFIYIIVIRKVCTNARLRQTSTRP